MPCPDGALPGVLHWRVEDSRTPVPHPPRRRPADGPRRHPHRPQRGDAQGTPGSAPASGEQGRRGHRGQAPPRGGALARPGDLGDRAAQPSPAHAGGLLPAAVPATESSRAFSGSKTVWSVWRNGHRAGVAGTAAEHWDPFSDKLRTQLGLCGWAARHDLRGDDGRRLKLDMNRLRTSVEVRRTRQMGGHLPSAARTNTMQTLWSSYLRGDPAVTEWADGILADAFADAERAALDAHHRALASHSGALRIVPGQAGAAAGPPGRPARTRGPRARQPRTRWTRAGPRAPTPSTARGTRGRAQRRSWTASTAGTA